MIVLTEHILSTHDNMFMRLGKHWAFRVFGFSASLETERRYRLIFGKSGLRLINFSRVIDAHVIKSEALFELSARKKVKK